MFGPCKPWRKEKALLFTWLYGRETIKKLNTQRTTQHNNKNVTLRLTLYVIMLSVTIEPITLSVVMLGVVWKNFIMLDVIFQNVIKLSVVMLSVMSCIDQISDTAE